MARVPAVPVPSDPGRAGAPELAWVLDGRWRGCRGVSLHDHECDRAGHLSSRWATPGSLPPDARGARDAAGPAPPRLTGLQAAFLCGSCPHAAVCRGAATPARGCRTCASVQPRAGEGWFCALHGDLVEVDLQRVGCDLWEAFADDD